MNSKKVVVFFGILFFVFAGFIVLALLVVSSGGGFSGHKSIAVVDLKGSIGDEDSMFSSGVSFEQFEDLMKEAVDDPNVVAIIIDIDSPGGAVIDSKRMSRLVKEYRAKKPIVALIGGLGVSGAYYVASSANTIVADEDSIVGSIGVVSEQVAYYGLLRNIGVNVTVIKSGRFKDIGSPYREMTSEERAKLEDIVSKIHSHFVRDVASNRGMKVEEVEKLADGFFYLGSDAKELGLVDELGGMNEALDIARELADSPDAEIYYVKPSPTLAEELFGMSYYAGQGFGDTLLKSSDNINLKYKLEL